MNTHTYSIALPALPEEFAYALNPATGCVMFRPHRKDEWYLSPINNQPAECSYDCRDSQLILVKAPEGYRFQRDKEGRPVYANPTQHQWFINKKGSPQRLVSKVYPARRYILEKLPEPIPAPPEGFEWLLDEKGERVERIPEMNEYYEGRDHHNARIPEAYQRTNKPWLASTGRYILKKIKPSYTEAVKAAGFKKWPFNHSWKFAAYTPMALFKGYSHKPRTEGLQGNVGWFGPLYTDDILNPSFLPPRLADDYEWHETLLCIDDFEV